jgi:hypothetical protein
MQRHVHDMRVTDRATRRLGQRTSAVCTPSARTRRLPHPSSGVMQGSRMSGRRCVPDTWRRSLWHHPRPFVPLPESNDGWCASVGRWRAVCATRVVFPVLFSFTLLLIAAFSLHDLMLVLLSFANKVVEVIYLSEGEVEAPGFMAEHATAQEPL